MSLPRVDEYNLSVQNPHIAFTDSDLKNSSAETNPLGLPKPYAGGFTITYKLSNTRAAWAVRCFHRDIQDLQQRYQSIGNFLSKNPSPHFVGAEYLAEGIKINGKGYPIIKMQWAEGELLNDYLNNSFNKGAKVKKILADFVQVINELEKFGIAHGDLQHGNIIVKNDRLLLIDYDGMYFPELASLKTNEIGHVNYQHPNRSASHYNQYIDRFSSIVIYLGLKAISLKPALWNKYEDSEKILFHSHDYKDPQHSPLIQDLKSIAEIRPLVEGLIDCCYLDFEKVPSLKDFLSGKFSYNKSVAKAISITESQEAADIFNNLYKDKQASTPPKTTATQASKTVTTPPKTTYITHYSSSQKIKTLSNSSIGKYSWRVAFAISQIYTSLIQLIGKYGRVAISRLRTSLIRLIDKYSWIATLAILLEISVESSNSCWGVVACTAFLVLGLVALRDGFWRDVVLDGLMFGVILGLVLVVLRDDFWRNVVLAGLMFGLISGLVLVALGDGFWRKVGAFILMIMLGGRRGNRERLLYFGMAILGAILVVWDNGLTAAIAVSGAIIVQWLGGGPLWILAGAIAGAWIERLLYLFYPN